MKNKNKKALSPTSYAYSGQQLRPNSLPSSPLLSNNEPETQTVLLFTNKIIVLEKQLVLLPPHPHKIGGGTNPNPNPNPNPNWREPSLWGGSLFRTKTGSQIVCEMGKPSFVDTPKTIFSIAQQNAREGTFELRDY